MGSSTWKIETFRTQEGEVGGIGGPPDLGRQLLLLSITSIASATDTPPLLLPTAV